MDTCDTEYASERTDACVSALFTTQHNAIHTTTSSRPAAIRFTALTKYLSAEESALIILHYRRPLFTYDDDLPLTHTNTHSVTLVLKSIYFHNNTSV